MKVQGRLIVLAICVRLINSEFSPLNMLGQEIKIVPADATFDAIFPFSNGSVFSILLCFGTTSRTTYFDAERDVQMCTLEIDPTYGCVNLEGNAADGTTFTQFDKNINYLDLNTTEKIPYTLLNSQQQQVQQTQQQPQSTQQSQTQPQSNPPNVGAVGSVSLQIYPNQVRVNLGLEIRKFYHLVSCESYVNEECQTFWKINYMHTFTNAEYQNNLIVQKNHYCGVYNSTLYNHAFYGGAIREDQKTMFFAVLVDSTDLQPLNMWGALSYTDDHTNKDMFCFSSANGNSFDALSLMLGAPYKDVAANINGEESTNVICNSFSGSQPFPDYYFIQYYRTYDTQDFVGDDRLFHKIEDHFAYASYFHSSNSAAVSCTNGQYKHQFVFLIPIDLSLHAPSLTLPILLLIALWFSTH